MQIVTLNENYRNKFKDSSSKSNRPYYVAFEITEGIEVFIPLRSHIKHQYSFIFNEKKDTHSGNKGLDFTKSLLISKTNRAKAISSVVHHIDEKAYKALVMNQELIKTKYLKYVAKYVNEVIKQISYNLDKSAFLKFSTLQNYHEQLGIVKAIEQIKLEKKEHNR